MQTIPIDLSALTPEERQQFADNPSVLSSDCEAVCCLYMRYSSDRQTEQSIEGAAPGADSLLQAPQLPGCRHLCLTGRFPPTQAWTSGQRSSRCLLTAPDRHGKPFWFTSWTDLPGTGKTAPLPACGSVRTAATWNPRKRAFPRSPEGVISGSPAGRYGGVLFS